MTTPAAIHLAPIDLQPSMKPVVAFRASYFGEDWENLPFGVDRPGSHRLETARAFRDAARRYLAAQESRKDEVAKTHRALLLLAGRDLCDGEVRRLFRSPGDARHAWTLLVQGLVGAGRSPLAIALSAGHVGIVAAIGAAAAGTGDEAALEQALAAVPGSFDSPHVIGTSALRACVVTGADPSWTLRVFSLTRADAPAWSRGVMAFTVGREDILRSPACPRAWHALVRYAVDDALEGAAMALQVYPLTQDTIQAIEAASFSADQVDGLIERLKGPARASGAPDGVADFLLGLRERRALSEGLAHTSDITLNMP